MQIIAYLPLLRSEKLTSSFLRHHSFLQRQPLLLVRQPLLEKVVLLGIVDGNMNDHIWEVAPILALWRPIGGRWLLLVCFFFFFFENIGLLAMVGPYLLNCLPCILSHLFYILDQHSDSL